MSSRLSPSWATALIRAFGGEPATSVAAFDQAARKLVTEVLDRTEAKIVLLTPAGIDERFYPGTGASMSACAATLHGVAEIHASTRRVEVCDVAGLLERDGDFFADGFHPNHQGHRKLAAALNQLIKR